MFHRSHAHRDIVQDKRLLDTRIYKRGIQFLAVLGSQYCREKKIQTAISMLLLRSVFNVFMAKKMIKNIVAYALNKGEYFSKSILFWYNRLNIYSEISL